MDNLPLTAMLFGETGSGKSDGMLRLLRGWVGPQGRIAVINTERKGLQAQIGQHTFDEIVLEPEKGFAPDKFIDLARAAVNEGYDGLGIDSISDLWEGPGGMLEIKKGMDERNKKLTFSNWTHITRLCDEINRVVVRECGIHVVYTAYAKEKLQQRPDGEIIHLGIQPRARYHLYERLDFVIRITDGAHNTEFVKNRFENLFAGRPPFTGPITVEKAAGMLSVVHRQIGQAREIKATALDEERLVVTIDSGKDVAELQGWAGTGQNEVLIFPGQVGAPFTLPATIVCKAVRRTKPPLTATSHGSKVPVYDVASYEPYAATEGEEEEESKQEDEL